MNAAWPKWLPVFGGAVPSGPFAQPPGPPPPTPPTPPKTPPATEPESDAKEPPGKKRRLSLLSSATLPFLFVVDWCKNMPKKLGETKEGQEARNKNPPVRHFLNGESPCDRCGREMTARLPGWEADDSNMRVAPCRVHVYCRACTRGAPTTTVRNGKSTVKVQACYSCVGHTPKHTDTYVDPDPYSLRRLPPAYVSYPKRMYYGSNADRRQLWADHVKGCDLLKENSHLLVSPTAGSKRPGTNVWDVCLCLACGEEEITETTFLAGHVAPTSCARASNSGPTNPRTEAYENLTPTGPCNKNYSDCMLDRMFRVNVRAIRPLVLKQYLVHVPASERALWFGWDGPQFQLVHFAMCWFPFGNSSVKDELVLSPEQCAMLAGE